jgi:hypothetical protein
MSRQEMERLLASILQKERTSYSPPSATDWELLQSKFGCRFEDDFQHFVEIMAEYQFPGEIYNVSTENTNGNDPIALVYDLEMKQQRWDHDMIPFYGIGNGDYFCISRVESPSSAVYYYYSEQDRFEAYATTFEEWVRDLPRFLASK